MSPGSTSYSDRRRAIKVIIVVLAVIMAWGSLMLVLLDEYKNAHPKSKEPRLTHLQTLQKSADMEHELGLIPHNDSDISDVCLECNTPSVNPASSLFVNTPNEMRREERWRRYDEAVGKGYEWIAMHEELIATSIKPEDEVTVIYTDKVPIRTIINRRKDG